MVETFDLWMPSTSTTSAATPCDTATKWSACESKSQCFAAISSDGIPFQIYRVPHCQRTIIGFLLGIEADFYHQIYADTDAGIVNCYCADTG